MTARSELTATKTSIPGLVEFDVPVFSDERGWFKESYNRQRLDELGLMAGFTVVQANVSFNENAGVTRGIHAEPWDKHITILNGLAFAAIVDLRDGENFGVTETFELDPTKAIFVPRGCGNSYQTLEPRTVYSYLVNDTWSPGAKYTMVNLADERLAIDWPIPLEQSIISDKDKGHPKLNEVAPIKG